MKVNICVLLTHGFPVPAPFFKSFAVLEQYVLQGIGNGMLPEDRAISSARLFWEENFPVDFGRNHACAAFLDTDDSDYLLFLDADMTHPPDLVHRLVKHDLDVVTARYAMRKAPFFTVAMRKVGADATEYQAIEKLLPLEQIRGLVPIDAGGAGALMISRQCLAAIRERVGDDWFRYQDGPAGSRSRSEDMWFYEQARAAGYQPFLDADLSCGHIMQTVVDHRDHVPFHERHQQALAAQAAPRDEVTV